MKLETFVFTGAAVLCAASLLAPPKTLAARHNFNLNFNGEAETCADLRVSSNNGEVAKISDSFTMTRREAPLLELNAGDHGHIQVRGWDRADYTVETCRVAVAETRTVAEQMARSVSINRSAG